MKKCLFAAAAFLAAALLIRFLSRGIPGFADAFGNAAGPVLTATLGGVLGLFPFSVAELLIYAGILAIPGSLIFRLVRARGRKDVPSSPLAETQKPGARKGGRRGAFAVWCAHLCLLSSILFFLFECGEDSPFFRTPFSVANGIGQGAYTTAELARTAAILASRVNETANLVERGDDGLMVCAEDIERRCVEAIGNLGETYPQLSGFCPRPKPVLVSEIMSRVHFTGIFTAFTMEANYNRDMTAYNIPFTCCHELGHMKGVLMENEANFVGYLACREAKDADIRYSGALMGWIYVGNELYRRDRDAWREIAKTLDPLANADLEANTAFWKRYSSNVSEAATKLNDGYLKGQGQAQGVESYDRVVDLIVSFEES